MQLWMPVFTKALKAYEYQYGIMESLCIPLQCGTQLTIILISVLIWQYFIMTLTHYHGMLHMQLRIFSDTLWTSGRPQLRMLLFFHANPSCALRSFIVFPPGPMLLSMALFIIPCDCCVLLLYCEVTAYVTVRNPIVPSGNLQELGVKNRMHTKKKCPSWTFGTFGLKLIPEARYIYIYKHLDTSTHSLLWLRTHANFFI